MEIFLFFAYFVVDNVAFSIFFQSCYLRIDFKVKEDSKVYDAMKLMAAHHIGCLAVTDETGKITGVISERDYLCKVALLGKNSRV